MAKERKNNNNKRKKKDTENKRKSTPKKTRTTPKKIKNTVSNKTTKPKKHIKIDKLIVILKAVISIVSIIFVLYIFESIQPKEKVEIKYGGISQVVSGLKKQGYSVNIIDKYLLTILGTPRAGIIYFDKNETLSRINFLYKIANAKASGVDNHVTLIPGETLEVFFEKVAKQMNLNKTILMDEYEKQSFYKEAGISPDTYFTNTNMNEKKLIEFLLKPSEQKYDKLAKKYFGTYNKEEWNKILIKASIIQKEAANKEEMPIVSSVIDNRIAKKMKLQMDGALNYGKYSHIAVTAERIKADNTTFNTYKNYGLPESPVGSVSQEAIEAAIKPSKTNYLYFVKNKTGVHTFSKDFKSHRNAIEENK
ncbi:MAG: endolytic transglycosylase MltG [Sulfurovaceae bacterium]|nr:endolytic transglycosylase MltG [Sulfurovaceae bacterium]